MTFTFPVFQEKIRDEDPDIRHMALYDLLTELQKDSYSMDETTQRSVVDAVLRMLDDHSTEVQGVAVRCLSPLVKKIKESQAEKLVSSLCNTCLKESKKEKRDIASTALKTMVADIPSDFSNAVKKLATPLVAGIGSGNNMEDGVKLEVLDVLNDVLKRFGGVISDDHERLQTTLLQCLGGRNVQMRKKSIVCLASLSVHTTDALFNLVVKTLLDGIENQQGEDLRKYIQCCSAVSRMAGQRLGKFLDQFMPLLVKHIREGEFSEDDGDEVRENIIQAFESFVLRCPGQVSPFFHNIISVCKEFLAWDPNYSYEDEEECEAMDSDDEDIDDDLDDDELDQDEDDDLSWKVRKASAKCLSAIITTRPDMLKELYIELCSAQDSTVPDRFKDREESVKLDIFKIFENLLLATKIQSSYTRHDDEWGCHDPVPEVKPEAEYLAQVQGKVVKGLLKCLKEKSGKIKIGCFVLLKELAGILGPKLNADVPLFVSAIQEALTEKSAVSVSTLKTEVLTFLRLLLIYTDETAFQSYIDVLCPHVFTAVSDRYYKIIAEALRVCGELVRVVSKLPEGVAKTKTAELYNCVYKRLSTSDIDQDVKESAIVTMGRILYCSSHLLSKDELKKAEELLLQLLKHEMSRLTTIKTLSMVKNVDLDPTVLDAYLTELSLLLRKSNRPVRQAALTTLTDYVYSQHSKINPSIYEGVLEELAQLLSDRDLHLSYLGLSLCTAILSVHPQAVTRLEATVLTKVVGLLRSPLLQGNALDSVLKLFESLSKHSTIGYQGLLDQVVTATTGATSKQAISSVAQVIAVLCTNSAAGDSNATVQKYCNLLSSGDEQEVVLALSCLGEIGRHIDLSQFGNLVSGMRAHFDSPNEEIKSVASTALGRVSAGSPQLYLGQIISDIEANAAQRYLMLRCLKEMISVSAGIPNSPLTNHINEILPLLFTHSESTEEGVRNVVAECIGKLALMQPEGVLPHLKEHTAAGVSALKKATIITALKYTITENAQPIDAFLKSDLQGFLMSSFNKEESVKIRRAAVLLFTAAAHNKPALVKDDLGTYMPCLFAETELDKSLIREVNLGPFKHKVDDGLELRKAAFECMDILLDNTGKESLLKYPHNYPTFIARVNQGLKDENQDIRMLAHLMICKLTKLPNASVALLTTLDETADHLSATVTKKLKANSVQQEKDRHEDLQKSCLRALEALAQNVKGAMDNLKLFDLYYKTVGGDKDLKAMLEKIQKENEKGDEERGF